MPGPQYSLFTTPLESPGSFEGFLRNGFHVRIVTNCYSALEAIKASPPDLILCSHTCLNNGIGGLLGILMNEFDLLQTPLIVVTGDRPEEDTQMLQLLVGAVDYVPRSIDPRLLRWKVMNWTYLKREMDRLRRQSRAEQTQAPS